MALPHKRFSMPGLTVGLIMQNIALQASDVLDKVSAGLASQADATVEAGLTVLRHLLQALKVGFTAFFWAIRSSFFSLFLYLPGLLWRDVLPNCLIQEIWNTRQGDNAFLLYSHSSVLVAQLQWPQ